MSRAETARSRAGASRRVRAPRTALDPHARLPASHPRLHDVTIRQVERLVVRLPRDIIEFDAQEFSLRGEPCHASAPSRLDGIAVRAFVPVCVRAAPVDAFDLGLPTDSNFGAARPLPDGTGTIRSSLEAISGIPIVTGFRL